MKIYGQPQAAQRDNNPSLTIQNESPLLLEVKLRVENGSTVRTGAGIPLSDNCQDSLPHPRPVERGHTHSLPKDDSAKSDESPANFP